jgi:hypothetical protein
MRQKKMLQVIAELQGRIAAQQLTEAQKAELLARHQAKRYWQKTEIPASLDFCRRMEETERLENKAKTKARAKAKKADSCAAELESEIAQLKAKLVSMGVDVDALFGK